MFQTTNQYFIVVVSLSWWFATISTAQQGASAGTPHLAPCPSNGAPMNLLVARRDGVLGWLHVEHAWVVAESKKQITSKNMRN